MRSVVGGINVSNKQVLSYNECSVVKQCGNDLIIILILLLKNELKFCAQFSQFHYLVIDFYNFYLVDHWRV